MANKLLLIKIGGHQLADSAFLSELAAVIHDLDQPVVIVHGGGKEISELQKTIGIKPEYVDGVRITDEPSLAVVEMILCGVVNKRLVSYLIGAGVDAIGLSGVDRGLVRAVKMHHSNIDMGFTGSATTVRREVLLDLIAQGITPVLSPICLGEDGDDLQPIYNVNADHVAGAVAASINALRLVFLTNVPGVLVDGECTSVLQASQVNTLIEDGTIFGGMIPKVKTALQALEYGVPQAAITNLDGLKTQGGTVFTLDIMAV